MILYPLIPLAWQVLQQVVSQCCAHQVLLAGGCLRDLYADRKDQVKDLDFWPYWNGNTHRKQVIAQLERLGFKTKPGAVLAYTESNLSTRGIMAIDWLLAPGSGQEVNLIWVDAADPESVVTGFDFGLNQAAWDGKTWTISDAFFKDHRDKTISLIRDWEIPKRLRERVQRMQVKFPDYQMLFNCPEGV